jgi:hypothetical protein
VRELHFFKRSEYANPTTTQHLSHEDLSPQNNNCGNLKACISAASSLMSTVTSLMNMDASELVFYLHTTVLAVLQKFNRQQQCIRLMAGITRAILYRITEEM